MHIRPHKLFERFMQGLDAQPEISLVDALAAAPPLGEFLAELDPGLPLDWSRQSFQGLPSLRERVLEHTGTGAHCTIDDVLITAGAAEANFLAISQLVQPGDEMIVDVPGWPQPLVLGEAIGANVKRLPRYEDRGWRFDVDELEDLVSERTRLIFICHPNNPTGQVLTEAELEAAAAIADRVGAYLLCDEVYAGLEWDDTPIPRVADLYERGISTGSVSKVFGLQGLRTGWMICRDARVVFDAMVLREDTSEIMNIMGETIAELALRPARRGAALARARRAGRRNLDVAAQWIAQRPEMEWQRPAAGLILFCRLQPPLTGDMLADRLLQVPYNTLVMPGSAYGCPQHVRLGAGGRDETAIVAGLDRLGRCLDEMSAGTHSP